MMKIYSARKSLIFLVLIEIVIISAEYLNFTDVLSKKLAKVLLKRTGGNKYAINLEEGKQSLYRHIYSLEPLKFEIFKTDIKINLAYNFINLSKLQTSNLILFT